MQVRTDAIPADRATRWERLTALPLTFLSVMFLVVYAVPILRPDLPDSWRAACEATTVLIWLLFWVDFVTRLILAGERRRFLRDHLFDLAVLVLPMLRPLRALRLVTVVLNLSRRAESWARGRLAVYVGATTMLLVLVSALAVLDAERSATDSNITSFDDAMWWATVTITTVGYGDHFPVTATGRFVALGLMIGGIGLIGFVTGSLATWIVDRVSEKGRAAAATVDDIAALRAEIAALRRQLDPQASTTGDDPDRRDHADQPAG
ncbi:potassium channel family protein [Micromonospora endolithica]|uniref:Two pore domain potassium channel family protein n=1 Tax=Micromonospora endolithica TaxID=230091 RepID=A0A3A9ZGS6_9ACTN|nr:potassium channel family protein [Micromonospora endolithica]RKN47671.1 two pore domain potassium channel family protein [Micromonospora endolithica]TWJ21341.1 voltage-gated potassium channel [Micromonospora endolithica]